MKTFTLLLVSGCFWLHPLCAQRYLAPVFARNEIEVRKNVAYGRNPTLFTPQWQGIPILQQLLMDVYLPVGDTESQRPLVLYFHTGNFQPFKNPDPSSPVQLGYNGACSGQRDDSAAVEICTRLAQMGYVTASCDYRLGWLPFVNNQWIRRYTLVNAVYRGIQDANTAIRFFRRSVAEENNQYGIDSDKIALFGEGAGGFISLNATLLDHYDKIPAAANGKFLWNPHVVVANDPCAVDQIVPMVIEQVNGNPAGTTLGISPVTDPVNGCAVVRMDTLCYPNWPEYSSDFNLAVNLGGALLDTSWIDDASQNPQPALISFHVLNKWDVPYTSGNFNVLNAMPGWPVVEVQGSYLVHQRMEAAGQHEVFVNLKDNYLDLQINQLNAFARSPVGTKNPLAALFPLITPVSFPDYALNMPWEWTSFPGMPPIPGITPGFTCNTNKAAAMPYIDTIIRFFAPRACFALGLQGCIDQVLSEKEPLAPNIDVLAAPNPASAEFRFSSKNEILAIQIFDKTGRLVGNLPDVNVNSYTLQRSGLNAGMYIVKLSFREGFVTKLVRFE